MRETASRALAYLLGCATVFGCSVAWSGNIGSVQQQDPATVEGLLNCDRQAEREAAQASTLSPIAPTSVLNPILLLSDLNHHKQEEANQPQLLDQIELKRQQCRANVVAAEARRSQEVLDQRSDGARGYKLISFETFALDAKSMATAQARISMKGAYVPDGNIRSGSFPVKLKQYGLEIAQPAAATSREYPSLLKMHLATSGKPC